MKNKYFGKKIGMKREAKGGIMFRSFDLNKFIKLVEEKDEVVGIKFDGNNLELIVSKQPEDYE